MQKKQQATVCKSSSKFKNHCYQRWCVHLKRNERPDCVPWWWCDKSHLKFNDIRQKTSVAIVLMLLAENQKPNALPWTGYGNPLEARTREPFFSSKCAIIFSLNDYDAMCACVCNNWRIIEVRLSSRNGSTELNRIRRSETGARKWETDDKTVERVKVEKNLMPK